MTGAEAAELVEKAQAYGPNAATELSPRDGYRVALEQFQSGDPLRLILYLRSFGEDVKQVEIATWEEISPYNVGDARRTQLLAEAICRFCNTGGECCDLPRLLGNMQSWGGLSTIQLPGYFLACSDVEDGQHTHTFLRDDNDLGLVWVEGVTVDPITRTELAEALDLEAEFCVDRRKILKASLRPASDAAGGELGE